MSAVTDAEAIPGDAAGWRSIARILAWLVAIAFVVAAVLFLLLAFNILVPAPEPNPAFNYVEATSAAFEHQARLWPIEIPSTLLFALGFFALGGLGLALTPLLDRTDAGASLGGIAFAIGGSIAAVTQVVYLGGALVASNPQYCDCVFAPEQVLSQATAIGVLSGARDWLLGASFIVLAAGMWLVGSAARDRIGIRPAWATLSIGLALVFVLAAVVGVVAPVIDLGAVPQLVVLLGAGILLPVWAIWLARQLAEPEPMPAA